MNFLSQLNQATRKQVILGATGILVFLSLLSYWHTQPRLSLGPVVEYDTALIGTAGLGDNLHLSQEQCKAVYPSLYHEADRARRWTMKQGGLKLDDLDRAEKAGAARVVIYGNKLYVKAWHGGINTRAQASLAALHDVIISSPEPLPDMDLVIQTGDNGDGDLPAFALSRRPEQESLWLMPDFGFYSWPEPLGPEASAYHEVRQAALEKEWELAKVSVKHVGTANLSLESHGPPSWHAKIPKLLWRGIPMVDVRQDLMRASRDQPWSDVVEIDWGRIKETGFKTPAEHCDYRFLAQVEGWGYSGRLKYLQQCRSVIVSHPLTFIQHFHHLFNTDNDSPHQNMVEVPLPLEEHLPGVMEALIEDDERSERIASNSWSFLREHYLSPAATNCYYRYALRAYASTQAFTVKSPRQDKAVAYESFLLTGNTHWDQH